MRIAILCQEEPLYFGPFLRQVLQRRRSEVVRVYLAGSRGAGGPRRGLETLGVLWLVLEPAGFFRSLAGRAGAALLARAGLLGTPLDRRSVRGAARRLGIPVEEVTDPNAPEFVRAVRELAPDVLVNQTELLLKAPLLRAPRLGVLNRHASLLPRYRGRLASWRAHAAEPPEYGVTIHLLDEGVDSGPIILQKRFELDPRWPYPRVLAALFRESAPLLLEALDRLCDPAFRPLPNPWEGTPTWPFPTLAEARAYRRTLAARRRIGE